MILYTHMLKSFFKFVFGIVVLSLFLFILLDFIHKSSGSFGVYNPKPEFVLKYYLLQIPLQLGQMLPLASLLASLLVTIMMQRANEITVMRAAGMSIYAIAAPLLFGGALLTLLVFVLNEAVVPYAAHKVQYIAQVEIEKGRNNSEIDNKNHWWSLDQGFYHFHDYDFTTQTLHGFRLVQVDEGFNPRTLIYGDRGVYLPARKSWHFPTVTELSFLANGALGQRRLLKDWELTYPVISPAQMQRERRLPDELSFGELERLIGNNSRRGRDVLELKVAWHVKIAYPLAIMLCSLMGISFAFRSERTSETVRSVLIVVGIGVAYWFVLSACRSLGNFASIPPVVAGWFATLVLAAYVGFQLLRLRRL
jgi:lipopolysaccharide export system permease protein